VRTWPTTDRDGVFSTTEHSHCSTTSEDSVGGIFGLLARYGIWSEGESNMMISNHDGGLIACYFFFYLGGNPC
jgi:hypothetical protein